MTHRLLIGAGVALAVSTARPPLHAQQFMSSGQDIGTFSYFWSQPTADAHNFVRNDSWIGFALDFKHFINLDRTFAVGGLVAWNELYENTARPINFTFSGGGAGTIQGSQYRNMNIFPLMVGGAYYWEFGGSRFAPFAGADLGVYYIHQYFSIGTLAYSTSNWIFGWAPQVGIRTFLASGTMVTLYARYNWPVNAGAFLPTGQSQSMQHLSIGIGFGYGR